MKGKIVLVTGGARSGKSVFAERYVASLAKQVAYIATAQVFDHEMAVRVAQHRQRRPDNWLTYEAPFNAEEIILDLPGSVGAVLFDCLTIYTSNLLLAPYAPETPQDRFLFVQAKIAQLIESARMIAATTVFVTNEVGMGIVPDNAMAREYRDLAGMVNQEAAAAADEAYLVVSGLAVEIKKLATVIK